MRDDAYETYTLEHAGMQFEVKYYYDPDMREPWIEHEGHGVVSDWTTRAKRPRERILSQDGNSYRYYDFAASVKIAKKDGWGDGQPDAGRNKAQIAASATEKDYAHLKAWCDNEWYWVYVAVTLLDDDGNKTGDTEYLSGIESDPDEYMREVAIELAGNIVERFEREASYEHAR